MRLLPVLFMLVPVAAAAQSLPVVAVDRQVFASAEGTSIGYHEHVDGGTLDRERGWVPGFGVGARDIFDVLGLVPIYAGIEYHRADGFIGYRGSDFDTGAPLSARSGYNTDDISGEIGPTFLINPRLLIAPVVQAGYHHWFRSLGGGENEYYSHVSLGAGVRVNYEVAPRLVGTLRVGVAGMVDPHIDIDFRGNFHQSLGGGPIYQAGGKLDYAVLRPLHVFAGVDFTRFTYGHSNGSPFGEDETIFEPNSTTSTVRLSAGVGFGF